MSNLAKKVGTVQHSLEPRQERLSRPKPKRKYKPRPLTHRPFFDALKVLKKEGRES